MKGKIMKPTIKLILMVMLMVSANAVAQGEQTLSRKERKAIQEQLDSLKFVQAVNAIDSRQFTLEAERVVFKRGQTAYVTSNTNFVSVVGDKAVVQVAFNIPGGGLNGVGGVTVEGTVSGYEYETTKRGDIHLTMNVMGRGISASLFIVLTHGTGRAQVTVTPNFNSRELTLVGVLVPSEFSNVFQGTSL